MILSIKNLILIPFLFIILFVSFAALFISIESVQNHFNNKIYQNAHQQYSNVKTTLYKIAMQDFMRWSNKNSRHSFSYSNRQLPEINHIDISYQPSPPYLFTRLTVNNTHINIPFSFNRLTSLHAMVAIYIQKEHELYPIYETKNVSGQTIFKNKKQLEKNQPFNQNSYSNTKINTDTYRSFLFQHPKLKELSIGISVPTTTLIHQQNIILGFIIFGFIIINILCISIFYLILKKITLSLSQVTIMARRISKGQSTSPVKVSNSNEIGLLVQSFNNMLNNVQTKTAELIYERNRSNMILTQLPEGIIVTDLNHKLLLANRAAETMLGFSTDKAKGQEIIKYLKHENLSSFFSNEIKSMKEHSIKREIKISNENTPNEFFQIIASPLLDVTYQKNGMIIVIRNITKEKTKQTTRNNTLSYITHELKTPLTSIIGFLDILSKETHGKLNHKQKEFITISSFNSRYLKKLINNVLFLSQIHSENSTLKTVTFNLNHMINTIKTSYISYLAQRSNTLSFELQSNQLMLEADKNKVYQIIENLIINANKYTENGTIKCIINQTESFTTFIIRDSGTGMSENERYDLYKSLEKTVTQHYSNELSLELTLIRDLIHLQNAQIYVESELGQGTTFTVIFPHPSNQSNINIAYADEFQSIKEFKLTPD